MSKTETSLKEMPYLDQEVPTSIVEPFPVSAIDPSILLHNYDDLHTGDLTRYLTEDLRTPTFINSPFFTKSRSVFTFDDDLVDTLANLPDNFSTHNPLLMGLDSDIRMKQEPESPADDNKIFTDLDLPTHPPHEVPDLEHSLPLPPVFQDQEEVDLAGQILDEVRRSAQTLALPTNPSSWGMAQVHGWLRWVEQQHRLPSVDLANFLFTGLNLCLLSKKEFEERTAGGDVLFAQLQVWQNAHMYDQSLEHQRTSNTPLGITANREGSRSSQDSMDSESAFPLNMSYSQSLDNAFPPHQPAASPVQEQRDTFGGCFPAALEAPWAQTNFYSAPGAISPMQSSPSFSSSSSSPSIPTPTFTTPVSTFTDTMTIGSGSIPANVGRRVLGNYSPRMKSHDRDPMTFDLDRPIHLWEFLQDLLEHPALYSNFIRWIDRSSGVFKIEDSVQVAKLWGRRKNRPAMNYDKLSRSVRQYYKKGIIVKTDDSKRLIYKFGSRYLPK